VDLPREPVLLRVERAAVSSALRNPIQEVPQLPLIRIHGGAGFAAQRCNELFKQRARDPHFGASLFLVRVFACHLGVYTLAGADFPIQFATESMFCDELSGTSYIITDFDRFPSPCDVRSRTVWLGAFFGSAIA
jgi:hypothetical protein